ncbi:hypothetical protein V865_008523 [Kwoniella europaea PYCC6329]|uniref:Uncharacterized protein n=1 Tax=Kwoniella europaea PYCC6329 TaxID=1423913 RepID=A0AAX4KYH0_9TREE
MSLQDSLSNSATNKDDTSITDTDPASKMSRQAKRRAKRSKNNTASASASASTTSGQNISSTTTTLTEEYLRETQPFSSSRSGVDTEMLIADFPEHHGSKMDEPIMVVQGMPIRRRDVIETRDSSTDDPSCESIFLDYCRDGITGSLEIPTGRPWRGA